MSPNESHASIDGLSFEDALSRIYFRVDWQTLRRLPVSGAIAFNFKALFTPLDQLKSEPYIPALAMEVLKEGKTSVLEYKGIHRTASVVIPTLEEYAREQVELRLVPQGWEVETLEESPSFPGWEEQWLKADRLICVTMGHSRDNIPAV